MINRRPRLLTRSGRAAWRLATSLICRWWAKGGPIWPVGWMARATPLFTRRIVGWRVDNNMEDALVIDPLRSALKTRQPAEGLIVHSDRGGQYVSNDLRELIRLWKIRPSMSRADDPYDNAFAESFWTGPPVRPTEGGNAGRRRAACAERS